MPRTPADVDDPPTGSSRKLVERAFREEYGRVVGALVASTGDFELAEDAVSEAFVAALSTWSDDRLPDNPGAWLTTTARRKAIDRLRRTGDRGAQAGRAGVPRRGRGRRRGPP